ncbi:MAG: carboxypeptidase [Actinomycetota bacterium]|jgi:hypothetical protein|nr:carboxypeptidase [Actinomycetota bacterium]
MKLRTFGMCLALAMVLATTALPTASVAAKGAGVPSINNMGYAPKPEITAIPAQPDPAAVPKANPGGKYNAYDVNVFETFWYPERQAADASAEDPPGGAVSHGTCPEGGCPNHELEFIKFWKKLMNPLVKPYGGVVHTYPFFSEGSGTPDGAPLNSPPGPTFNLMATIPGDTHPEQMVIVSGHYDQTDSGPASAWDSSEGHATVFRIAKIMTDYWRKTGTRPDVSVKFSAWGAEEAGTYGSQAFLRDNFAPFPNANVRGYFNLDPCAGAYPAYYRGNPADRVPMVMQLADPAKQISPIDKKEIEDFNKQARVIVGDVFNHLDDTLTDVPTAPEIFVSDEEAADAGVASQEDEIVTAVGGLAAFSSDYANFEQIGVPIINLFPDMFGPHSDRSYTGYRSDGVSTIHTPQDNVKTLNALTGLDQTGLVPSEGWYKGLELCAHLHSWFMLQSNMGGAVKNSTKPVAYYEVRGDGYNDIHGEIAPLHIKKPLHFDAHGSHAFTSAKGTKLVSASKLHLSWNFGDGGHGKGFKINHTYKKPGNYKAVLTVRSAAGSDTMTLLIHVE